ncbi:MAG: RNA polymerase sigma factor [Egibacteraceae bacterium]
MGSGDLDAVARRAANGDGAAFEALCRALQDDVWRYCYSLTGNRELAFDAAQETFLRAVTAIRRFRGDGPVRVWLLVIARRAVARTLREQQRRLDLPVGEALPERAVLDQVGRVEVERLVHELPMSLRQAFVLTQILGLGVTVNP